MAEPTTVLTDYALAAVAILLGQKLLRSASPLPVSRRLWAAAFLLSALGAVLGGTRHAFGAGAVLLRHHLWTATYLVLGLANLAFLAGAVRAALPRPHQPAAVGLLVVRFAVYVVLVLGLRQLPLVVADFALTLLLLLGFALYSLVAEKDGPGAWLLGGILVSALGAAVQAARVPPLAGLNHSDLFHVIQMVGAWAFYRAGLRLRDR